MDKKKFKLGILLLIIGAFLYSYIYYTGKFDEFLLPLGHALVFLGTVISITLIFIGAILMGIFLSYPNKLTKVGMSISSLSIVFTIFVAIFGKGGHPDGRIIIFILLIPLLLLGILVTIIGGYIYKKSQSKPKGQFSLTKKKGFNS